MFVHVYTGYEIPLPITGQFGGDDIYYNLMENELGRASVPLLSIISGWLLMSARPRPYGALVRLKVRSLVIPMLLWNAAMLCLVVGYGVASANWKHTPTTIPGILNGLLAIDRQPLNVPVGFLRDLFVTFLFSPLILLAVRRAGFTAVVGIAILGAILPDPLVFLRNSIVFYFALGAYLRHADIWRPRAAPLVIAAVVALTTFGLAMAQLQSGKSAAGLMGDSPLVRLALAYLFWKLSVTLATSRAVAWFVYLEQFAFLVFCSHFIVFRIAGLTIGKPLFGDLLSPEFAIYFTLQPIVCYLAVIVMALALRRVPKLLALLNAGKLPKTFAPPFAARKAIEAMPPV